MKDIFPTPAVNNNHRMAILIDGDNAQASLIGEVLAETSKYGLITIRRIYGDWTTANMGGWKETLHSYAIQPIQQFRYTIGKNATDSAMIIDAMDILHSGVVDSFCLVSSDSDYTRLATRIREKGFFVMGIGKQSTPRAFVNACDVFVYTENIAPEKVTTRRRTKSVDTAAAPAASTAAEPPLPEVVGVESGSPDPMPLLRSAFDMAVQDDGTASLGAIGNYLRQLDPGFDARTYGYKQLSLLIKGFPKIFMMKQVKRRDGQTAILVKLKE